jgi:uncharacterized protein YjbI with pentapeptide repeats
MEKVAMNKYVRKLFGVMFQGQQTQQVFPDPLQHSPTSAEEWRAYWKAQGQSWRTEPEIDIKRQEYLAKLRAISPDIKQGIYPFKGIKLSRADIEWLLATHESVDWGNERYLGIDLRGADLCQVNLRRLPLADLYAGLIWEDWKAATVDQRSIAEIHLERAILAETHLEGAQLRNAHLEGADLSLAHLENAHLFQAHLECANLFRAHLEGVNLRETHLAGANLQLVYFDHATSLDNTILVNEKHGFASFADVHWGAVNLSVVDWKSVKMLGDESKIRQSNTIGGKIKQPAELLKEYHTAVRANRQLAVVLQDQGLNEEAVRFAYRAQVLQRRVLWKQHDFGKWFFSLLLALLAGYGYRMGRIIIAYLLVVFVCAAAYFVLGMYYTPHLSLVQAFLESITAFHGRVFLEVFASDTPQIWVTAFEAVAGLLIEGVFIAMLTQRFFGK